MMRETVARRHRKPRYQPLAPNRPIPDPLRAEKPHPSWCECKRCAPPGPADRRRFAGCASAIGSFLVTFMLGVLAVAIGVGAVAAFAGTRGLTLIGLGAH